MNQTLFPAPATSLRAAERWWQAAVGVLCLLPVGMAVAHRSAPAFLVLSALLALVGLAAEGRFGDLDRRLRAGLGTALGQASLAFLLWALVSIAWSAYPAVSARAFGEFCLPVAAAWILAVFLPRRMPRWAVPTLGFSLVAACAMMLAELNVDIPLRQDLGGYAATYIFNRPTLTVLTLSVPALLALTARGSWSRILALVLAAAAVWLTAVSESGAARFGLLAGVLVFVLAAIGAGWVRRLAIPGVVLAVALAPVAGAIGDRLIPASVHQGLADSHSRDRIDIWLSFGAAVREQPVLGGGFGVSPRMGDTPVASEVPPDRRTLLGVGHPHNAALQIWAELGLVGAALAAWVLVAMLRAFAALPRRSLAAALALTAGAGAVALVGHGAWQGWWAASLGAAVVLFRSFTAVSQEASE